MLKQILKKYKTQPVPPLDSLGWRHTASVTLKLCYKLPCLQGQAGLMAVKPVGFEITVCDGDRVKCTVEVDPYHFLQGIHIFLFSIF